MAVNDDLTIPSDEVGRPSPAEGGLVSRKVEVDKLTAADFPVLFGRYEIQGLLGEGGMARVFLAELRGPAGFRKPVALKVIKPKGEQSVTNQQVLDLVQEACLAGRLKHPNLLDVYELGEIDEQLFISMELVEGRTLHHLVQSAAPIPNAVAMEIAVAMTAGLAKAHRQVAGTQPTGLVHRDLKPSNILISEDGAVKIADFGVAIPRSDGGEAFATSIRGTPSYMSPEQVMGQPLDGRSDLFSLALVIGEMVLKTRLLGDKYVVRQLHAGLALIPPLLNREQLAGLDDAIPGLGQVVLRCLEPERENRYRDADHLLEDLQKLQQIVGYAPRLRVWVERWGKPVEESVPRAFRGPVRDAAAPHGPKMDATTAVQQSARPLGNLGPTLDHFVGRESELTELECVFSEGARLVTLKGVGGAGKTRFSRRYARTRLPELAGGAWFVDLTEAVSLRGVLHATAAVLELPLAADEDQEGLVACVGQGIASRGPVLIVLDNFEQVVEHAPATVGQWLVQAPEALFLVTSRESLKLSTEKVFPLQPLPETDGVRLFKLRARAAGARGMDTDDTDDTIRCIVQRLDGIPLAIELAAARAHFMSPAQILERLSERFKLLRGGRRGDAARQATLRGLIDWSWNLLEPWEQAALAQLSVFHGGFFMEAAEAVLDLSSWPEAPWSLDVVGSLLDKSLLHSRDLLGQPRFEMYVSIQEYAAEKRGEQGDQDGPGATEAVQRRHAAWFARLGDPEISRNLNLQTGSVELAVVFCELENLVAGVGHGTPETAAQCCIAALRGVRLKGPVSLGVELAAGVLELPGLSRPTRMQLEIAYSSGLRICGRLKEASEVLSQAMSTPALPLEAGERVEGIRDLGSGEEEVLRVLEADRLVELGNVELDQSNYEEATSCFQQALEICRTLSHKIGEGMALNFLGSVHSFQGRRDKATHHYQLALDIFKDLGDKHREGMALGNLGRNCAAGSRFDEALNYYYLAMDTFRERGDKRNEGITHGNLGVVLQDLGSLDAALKHYELSIEIHGALGARRFMAMGLGNVGGIYHLRGRHDEALEHYRVALDFHREVGDRRLEGIVLGSLGETLFRLGRLEEAHKSLEEAVSTCDEIGLQHVAGSFRGALALLLASQGQLEEAYRQLETGESQVRPFPQPHGRFLCSKGRVQLLDGNLEGAKASLVQAQNIAAELKVGERSDLAQAITGLQDDLIWE